MTVEDLPAVVAVIAEPPVMTWANSRVLIADLSPPEGGACQMRFLLKLENGDFELFQCSNPAGGCTGQHNFDGETWIEVRADGRVAGFIRGDNP